MKDSYVKLNGKTRKDKNEYTQEQVTAPEFTDDYGRLVHTGYAVFDFDDKNHAQVMTDVVMNLGLKCKILTTTRGKHFMFKTNLNKIKNKNGRFNWIGLKCDIKAVGIQEKNKKVYQAIKVNGEKRKEEYTIGVDTDEELDYAPLWLYHVPDKKYEYDLTENCIGRRNDLLHRRPNDTSKEEWLYL